MLDQLPPFLAAEVLKNLDAADLCRVEQVREVVLYGRESFHVCVTSHFQGT